MPKNIEIKKTNANKVQSGIEKRNIAITKFALFTLIPLLFCLFFGFSLSNSERQNGKNFHQQLDELKQENEDIKEYIDSLGNVFVKADEILSKFNNETIPELEEDLDETETDIAFKKWDNDREEVIDKFKHDLKKVTRPLELYPQINGLLDFGNKWLKDYAQVKDDELYIRKLYKKQEVGMEVSSDLQKQIQDLNNQLAEKNIALSGSQQQLQLALAISQKEKSGGQEKKEKLQNVGAIKDNIVNELDKIRSVLNKLQPKRWKNKNEEQIKSFKEELNTIINSIERHAGELK